MPKDKQAKLEVVLFDWDGTLLNSYEADSSAYLAMFREMGIDWGLAKLAKHYSPNWYDVYRAAGLSRKRWNEADLVWRRYYANQKPALMRGALQVLEKLRRRHRLGLVTSGDRERITRQLQEFRLTRLFPVRVCGGDTEQRKPHPEPLQLALRCMKLHPSACVYVGDSAEDAQMAQEAGVRVVAILGPFPTEKRLRAAKPDFLLRSIRELPETIKKLTR